MGYMCMFGITFTMRRNRIWLGFGRTARAVTAVFALVLVVVLVVFAASPSLHQRLHTGTTHPDAFCIVC
jgi:hypothetical protein